MARKPRGRWAYLEDFRPTADGQYVYTGALYSFAEGDEALKKHRRSLWLLSAPVFAVILALGFLRIPGMVGCAYVLIPYATELFCSGFTLWSLGSMTGKKLREYSYKRSVVRFPVFYPLTAILAAVCIVTEVIFVITNGAASGLWLAILYWALELVILALALLSRAEAKRARWNREENAGVPASMDEMP